MRIAILSDIHGNIWALEAVLAEIRAMRDIDLVVNAGDLLSGPLEPAATAELLMSLALPTVRGNHERQLLASAEHQAGGSDQYAFAHTTAAQHAWLAGLPATLEPSPGILMCHGTPGSDNEYLLETVNASGVVLDSDAAIVARLGGARQSLIICGHSHIQRVCRTATGQTIVNPGSVGLPAYDDRLPLPHRVENASPHARFAVCEARAGHWSVAHFAVDYPWQCAVEAALAHGNPVWARWLATGRA
jgi:predicted phosphodiesterase